MKTDTITLTDCLRAAGHTILPREGGWVSIRGNPFAPRGLRISRAHYELGIRDLDIYYAINEEICFQVPEGAKKELYKLRRRYGRLRDTPKERMAFIGEALYDGDGYSFNANNSGYQVTWMTANVPHTETVRFFNAEVRPFKESLIEKCLAANYLEIIPIRPITTNPILEEATRAIVDALQMDGLSYHQAIAETVRAGISHKVACPPWFYRPIGEYRDTFVEC